MTANLEARKLSIMEYLAELKDESVLSQIENLLKPKVDFWDELTDAQKSGIQKGIEQLNNGDKVAYEDFIKDPSTELNRMYM